MLDNLLQVIKDEGVAEQLFHSLIGIEVEAYRVDKEGRLSEQPYPRKLGKHEYHPYLKADKTKTKFEVVTDPNPNIGGVLDQLDTLQTAFYRSLEGDDRIWPLSAPPRANGTTNGTVNSDELTTGVHVNYSIPDPVINRLYSHYQSEYATVIEFKNNLYLRMMQNFICNRWLLTYLFGASPESTHSAFSKIDHPVRSIRNSDLGFVNLTTKKLSYASVEAHIADLNQQIKLGQLATIADYQAPIRMRGSETPDTLKSIGARYLEIRALDNTPFTSNGISRHALYFMKFFMIDLMVRPVDTSRLSAILQLGIEKNNRVALELPTAHTYLENEGVSIFSDLKVLASELNAHIEQTAALDDLFEVMTHPELTPAVMIYNRAGNQAIDSFALSVATRWRTERLSSRKLLPAIGRLSHKAQQVILIAIQRGIQYYQIKDEQGGDLLMLTYESITQVILMIDIEKYEPEQLIHKLFPTFEM
ncbi:gamma-glutamylcysteine synthetase [Secundilactobacillus malefermentans]|nr:gamma-glutamylcysteine synthetase [Secundilactobacillus malefermentans]